ncbi:MAG: YvaD family protein, partial [Spirochaetia bacterium]|nr:YvaD family protein [Spirochaetia bacterium]
PAQFLFPNYEEKVLVIWNWSFLPLDFLVTLTGLTALTLEKQGSPLWKNFAIMSLCFTMASGLMAIGFWSFQGWFDISWWLPNLYLMLYPIVFLAKLLREAPAQATSR